MAAGTPAMFPEAASSILRGWGALRLATEQSFGGPFSQQKAEWLEEVVVQYFVENADLEPSEVEDYLVVLMNQEFDTLVEDGSVAKVSSDLCHVFRQCCSGNLPAVKAIIEKAKTLPDQVIMEGGGGQVEGGDGQVEGGDGIQDNGLVEGDEGEGSHVSGDEDGDDRMSSEGNGEQMGEEDEGCQLPEGEGMEEQMEDLQLQDPLQNDKDESWNGDEDGEGWTVVSSKRKSTPKR